MKKTLSPNTIIEIIAPSGRVARPAESDFAAIEKLLKSWGYQARFGKHLLGDHPFLANTTELRFEDLKNALLAKDSEAIWCYRGGSGAIELLPLLDSLPPTSEKLFLGFSDITSLHTFFMQRWGWTTFHGPLARQTAVNEADEDSILSVKNIFQGKLTTIHDFTPLNTHASQSVTGEVVGGNLCILTHAFGTPYQIKINNQILLLEDLNEEAYKIRRMLSQLSLSGLLKNTKAIIFGEFTSKDPEQRKWIADEIKLFAETQPFPVYQTFSIGHGKRNIVMPLGTEVTITPTLI